jgi:hypothetical protein
LKEDEVIEHLSKSYKLLYELIKQAKVDFLEGDEK